MPSGTEGAEREISRESAPRLGYDAIWNGQKSWNGVAILSRVGVIEETRRSLDSDPDGRQSRYVEAAVSDILIGGLYLPNAIQGPAPSSITSCVGSIARSRAQELLETGLPVLLAGDFNVMPTERDAYKPERSGSSNKAKTSVVREVKSRRRNG